MLDLLWLMLASLPAGIGLYCYAEALWTRIEKRGQEERHSPRPLSPKPHGGDFDDEAILF